MSLSSPEPGRPATDREPARSVRSDTGHDYAEAWRRAGLTPRRRVVGRVAPGAGCVRGLPVRTLYAPAATIAMR
jgi:hypothetical protein